MVKKYTPERGDIISINLNPQAGHEQGGRRPALVLSPRAYNEKVGLAILCPITSQTKGYPFETVLPADGKITGVVLSDHVKNLDWKIRKARFIEKAKPAVVTDVLEKLLALVG